MMQDQCQHITCNRNPIMGCLINHHHSLDDWRPTWAVMAPGEYFPPPRRLWLEGMLVDDGL